MRPLLAQTLDADYGRIQAVMAAAGDVINESKSTEDADPWVVALAIDIAHTHTGRVVVVTEDYVDRLPIKIALTTACTRLGVDHCRAHECLDTLGIKRKKLDA